MALDSAFIPAENKCQRCGHARTDPIEPPDGKRKHRDDACACGCTSPFHRTTAAAYEPQH